jgi:hypothetical protein
VFRAMRNKSWTKTTNGRPLPTAFLRREADPATNREAEKALSVNVKSRKSCHDSLTNCYGVAELEAAACESLGLTITIDEHPHADLGGMPLQSEDKGRAEHLASQLAKIAVLVLPATYAADAE